MCLFVFYSDTTCVLTCTFIIWGCDETNMCQKRIRKHPSCIMYSVNKACNILCLWLFIVYFLFLMYKQFASCCMLITYRRPFPQHWQQISLPNTFIISYIFKACLFELYMWNLHSIHGFMTMMITILITTLCKRDDKVFWNFSQIMYGSYQDLTLVKCQTNDEKEHFSTHSQTLKPTYWLRLTSCIINTCCLIRVFWNKKESLPDCELEMLIDWK